MSEIQSEIQELAGQAYVEAYEAFRKNWIGDRPTLLQSMEAKLKVLLKDRTDISVLSVGAGSGEFDEQVVSLIQRLTGQQTLEYVAIEPDKGQFQALETKTQESDIFKNVTLEIQQVSAEEFQTDEIFNFIHFTHSMAHVSDEELILLSIIEKLKSQGIVMISTTIWKMGWEKILFNTLSLLDLPIEDEIPADPRILTRILAQHPHISYEYQSFPEIYIDVSKCFQSDSKEGEQLLTFLLHIELQQLPLEKHQLLSLLDEVSVFREGKKILPLGTGVFYVSKP